MRRAADEDVHVGVVPKFHTVWPHHPTRSVAAREVEGDVWAPPIRSRLVYTGGVAELLDLDALDEDDPFEIDEQAAHLFKHPHLGVDDVLDAWASDPLFYPAKPPAHWLMVAEVEGRVLVVPIAPLRSGNPAGCRPIGCYEASSGLATTYRRDRDDY